MTIVDRILMEAELSEAAPFWLRAIRNAPSNFAKRVLPSGKTMKKVGIGAGIAGGGLLAGGGLMAAGMYSGSRQNADNWRY